MNKWLAFALSTLMLAPLWPAAAGAQHATSGTTSASGADNAQSEGLMEIVVTAQRREESSQHAAIAISTIAGDALQNANITRPGGLTEVAPSLQVSDDTGPYSIFYVRGVGNFAANPRPCLHNVHLKDQVAEFLVPELVDLFA